MEHRGESTAATLLAAIALSTCLCHVFAAGADPFEQKRAEMVAKTGNCIFNLDGCEMVYYPKDAPITEEGFLDRKLGRTKGTKVTAFSYCPLSSGFGFFTALKAGDFMDKTLGQNRPDYNAAGEFARRLGTDALEMASRFARREGKNIFVSIRMNDTHDATHTKERPHPLFSPFKERHPECLVGNIDRGMKEGLRKWSSVDYSHEVVREALKGYVREFCENYDIDGVELDFNRHAMFFRSTFTGGVASEAEIAIMTQLMRDIRAITEELGRKRGRPYLLLARTDDSIAYDRAIGYDPTQWMAEGLIDFWIAGGYTRIEHYDDVVAVARRYPKVKVFASIDESRIDGRCKSANKPVLEGRSIWCTTGDAAAPFYAACISAAMASGFDGVWHFNLGGSPLPRVLGIDPADTEGVDKRYYATERDPRVLGRMLAGGFQFLKTPDIDPLSPRNMSAGSEYSFVLIVGDDFAAAAKKGKRPVCGIRMITTGSDKVSVSLNGELLRQDGADGGVLHFPVDERLVRRGRNTVDIKAEEPLSLNDFVLDVKYVAADSPAPSGALTEGADDLTVREFVKAARALYPTEAYQQYTNTLVWAPETKTKGVWRYDKYHDVPQGGRVSKCETTNDVRWVNVPGIRNLRDLGGWNGLKTGMAYRGSQLWNEWAPGSDPDEPSSPTARTPNWKGRVYEHPTPETAVAIRELGWKTDLDLRGFNECRATNQLPIVECAPQMQTKYARMLTYIGSLQGHWEAMRDALLVFCDEANYPIYFHCKAGADRTGTLAFFVQGICGCSQTDIDIDYELTSVCGDIRTRSDRECIQRMWECVKGYDGKTLEEKFANCAKHLWRLTDKDIATMRKMLKK